MTFHDICRIIDETHESMHGPEAVEALFMLWNKAYAAGVVATKEDIVATAEYVPDGGRGGGYYRVNEARLWSVSPIDPGTKTKGDAT